jgi:hypothetical protein
MACSATLSLLAAGTLVTTTFLALHAARSIMSVPIAWTAMSLSPGHWSNVEAVMGILDSC